MSNYSKVATSQFDIIHKNYLPWFRKADQLVNSSLLLRQRCILARKKLDKLMQTDQKEKQISKEMEFDLSCYQEASMLFGLAIENVLKGLWIIINGKKIKNDTKKLEMVLKSHDLLKISEEINLELNDEDEKIMQFFTEYVMWKGRYPIPLDAQQYIEHFESKNIIKFVENNENDLPKEIKNLWRKLISTRDELLKDQKK